LGPFAGDRRGDRFDALFACRGVSKPAHRRLWRGGGKGSLAVSPPPGRENRSKLVNRSIGHGLRRF
jgi:hypothetical protein